MSETLPAEQEWTPAFPGQRPPFAPGNSARMTHGLWSKKFRPLELEEITEVESALREVLPTYAAAFEPAVQLLASRIWRLRRAYAYIAAHEEEDISRNVGERLATLETLINRSMHALGLTPIAAAELGVNLARLAAAGEQGPGFDWEALSAGERAELDRLLAKGRAGGDRG